MPEPEAYSLPGVQEAPEALPLPEVQEVQEAQGDHHIIHGGGGIMPDIFDSMLINQYSFVVAVCRISFGFQ